jgi:DNA repair protein RecN (Recombination protein N)
MQSTGAALAAKSRLAETAYRDAATVLGKARRKTAKRFASEVTAAMADLGMTGGAFDVRLDTSDEPKASGTDDIEYLISPNPGQPLMPLAKIASGGELSRMNLAIQVIAIDGAHSTMIFNEVDSGVGSAVTEMVGRHLRELGERRQVLCVTHLAQVAGLADNHFRVVKITDGNSTRIAINQLNDAERIEELARMLGGMKITKKTRDHAAEMLGNSRRPQKSSKAG